MTTHDSKLTEQIPVLTEETDTLLTGESTLADHGGVPLTFGSAYLALLICRAGYANMTLNFKPHAVRAGDILVLAEDTIALLKKRSRGFRVFYCLIRRPFQPKSPMFCLTRCFCFCMNIRAVFRYRQKNRCCRCGWHKCVTSPATVRFTGISCSVIIYRICFCG